MFDTVTPVGKPLQVLPWAQKDQKWFRQNTDWFISKCNFDFGSESNQRKDIRIFYEVYNNQFPLEWFSHVTDPLSAKAEAHKSFPAKIRPVTILRTNIDLLLGEYPRRPFIYNVENLGEAGYNQYMDTLNNKVYDNLVQHFMQSAIQQAQDSGQQLSKEELAELQKNPPVPEEIKEEHEMSYKDAKAVKGQKWLRRVLREYGIKKKFHQQFKDWLIAGSCFSYKGVRNGTLVYRKVSPLNIDYDKSHESDYIEDGEWVVERRMLTFSDIVDEYYHKLKEDKIKEVQNRYDFTSADSFYSSIRGLYSSGTNSTIPVYTVQWKGKKRVKIIKYFDEDSMQMVEEQVDESFDEKTIPGATAEIEIHNEVYQAERIGKDLYIDGEAIAVQRNEMNNTSKCKLEYNGRVYSDLHADSVSVLELGLPFQIMTIIITYIIEKTVAKSKGKILLIDQNAIPDNEDWDEEKFFYYSEAMGYGLLDRSQIGVDKSWNQYQVLDMSLFDQIKQLIELKDSFKQEWDDIIGITRQRKGQTYASDAVGTSERSVFQSTVITDMIFLGFEEFTETEMQGLMDYAKFLNSQGHRAIYNDDDYGTQILEIAPDDFTNEDLGVFVDSSSEHMRKKEKMEQYATAMLQNNAKPSTMMEVIDTINTAELKAKLRHIEQIEQSIAQQQAETEQEHEQALEDMKQRYVAYVKLLDRQNMEAEYDRKEDLEYIKGSFSTFTFKDGDSNANGEPDTIEVEKMMNDRRKLDADIEDKRANRQIKSADLAQRQQAMEQDMQKHRDNLQVAHKKLKIDAKKAAQRPKSSTKK